MLSSFCLIILLPVILLSLHETGVAGQEKDLFITPMIKKGELDKAKAASLDNVKLSHIKSSTNKPLTSYSGFFTTDEKINTNLFFYFFPALEKPESAPLILWMNELPGYSCLKGIFLENGPVFVNEKNELVDRPTTWAKTHSMLYIDSPAGSGFSFTDKEEGYAKSPEEEARQTHEALNQFFTLFPEYQTRDFYLAGEIYSGTVIPHLATQIDRENSKGTPLQINLKGFIMGAAYADPIAQGHVAQYFYSVGLVDEAQRDLLLVEEDKIQSLRAAGKLEEALAVGLNMLVGPDSLFARFTGFEDNRNVLNTKEPAEIGWFTRFLDTKEVHNYLHVGLHKFELVNPRVFMHLSKEYVKPDLELLATLADKDYKILVYSGQFDPWIVHTGVAKMLNSLKWKGAGEYEKSQRYPWKVNGEVAGYVTSANNKNFNFILLRNAGNYAIMDQPEWTLDMVTRFTSGKMF